MTPNTFLALPPSTFRTAEIRMVVTKDEYAKFHRTLLCPLEHQSLRGRKDEAGSGWFHGLVIEPGHSAAPRQSRASGCISSLSDGQYRSDSTDDSTAQLRLSFVSPNTRPW